MFWFCCCWYNERRQNERSSTSIKRKQSKKWPNKERKLHTNKRWSKRKNYIEQIFIVGLVFWLEILDLGSFYLTAQADNEEEEEHRRKKLVIYIYIYMLAFFLYKQENRNVQESKNAYWPSRIAVVNFAFMISLDE